MNQSTLYAMRSLSMLPMRCAVDAAIPSYPCDERIKAVRDALATARLLTPLAIQACKIPASSAAAARRAQKKKKRIIHVNGGGGSERATTP